MIPSWQKNFSSCASISNILLTFCFTTFILVTDFWCRTLPYTFWWILLRPFALPLYQLSKRKTNEFINTVSKNCASLRVQWRMYSIWQSRNSPHQVVLNTTWYQGTHKIALNQEEHFMDFTLPCLVPWIFYWQWNTHPEFTYMIMVCIVLYSIVLTHAFRLRVSSERQELWCWHVLPILQCYIHLQCYINHPLHPLLMVPPHTFRQLEDRCTLVLSIPKQGNHSGAEHTTILV